MDNARRNTPRLSPAALFRRLTYSLWWLLFALHAGFIVMTGIWLEAAYMNSAIHEQRTYWQSGTYSLYLGRDPQPRVIFTTLLVFFAVHVAWIACWWLGLRDQTEDAEQYALNRRRRRRYATLGVHVFLAALVQFVTVALRDTPEMRWESGSQIRYPFTWMPFALMVVLLLLHGARTVYMEVMERHELRYAIAKHKHGGQLPQAQGSDFDPESSPFEAPLELPQTARKSRREG
jgi:hypothetical protein